ncbi:TolC family protein [Pseudomonas asplenii]|uniref:TolC family protein n=1 Tax=Pseudomonas asplenii TaxID=53407 RepID=UPI001E5CD86C|nr:TolC family protein [Pseudomonas fuscovaginae]
MTIKLPQHLAPARVPCALLLVLTLLGGCSVAPLPDLQPPTPDTWRNAPAGVRPLQADLNQWWRAFGDAQLDALVERALQHNLDVAQAVERLRATRLLSQHAQDSYRPSLAIQSRDAISPDTSTSNYLVGFDAQWELPLFGVRQSTDRLARGNEALAQADLRSAQVSLVAEVSRRWIELRSAQRTQQQLVAVQQALREKLRLLRVREQLKLATPVEIAEAQAELARADMALGEPWQAINHHAQQLALLLGQSEPDPLWLQPGPPPQLGQWQLSSVPADLLRTRPEITGAEALVMRAAGEAGLSRAEIYPHISLGTSLQWSLNLDSNRKRTRSGDSLFSYGPGISIPLFDWGQRVARADARDHQLQAALLAYRQSVLVGVAEVETALGDLEQSRQREQSSRQAGKAVQSRLQALRQRVGLGLQSDLELKGAQVEQYYASVRQARASAERGIAYIALYKALGGAPLPGEMPKETH